MPFDVLFVCTGNICRSPLMEYRLQQTIEQLDTQFRISSAGTHAMLGGMVPHEIAEQGRTWGADVSSHQPTQLTPALIQSSTLIITAERHHRAEVVTLVPSAAKKTYTLNQFARVAGAYLDALDRGEEVLPIDCRLAAFVSEIADYRALTPPPLAAQEDDIADPFRRGQADYDLASRKIEKGLEVVIKLLSMVR